MANKIYPLKPSYTTSPTISPPANVFNRIISRRLKAFCCSRLSRFVLLSLVLLITFLVSLALGSVAIPPSEVMTVLLGGTATKPAWQEIILTFRLPRSLTALAAGSALAISGLQLQALFRNALAGPSVLGINAGASLGAALVVLTGGGIGWWGQLSVVGAASGGAAIAMLLVLLMARQVRSSLALLIFGLMLGYVTTALVTILLHFSRLEQTLAYLNWTFGSFNGVTWQQMPILLSVVTMGLVIAQLTCKPLNLLLLGEEQAISLGLSVTVVRCYLIFSASLLAGSITAFCGPIAFLGVAVPHLGRSLFRTQDHRILVPVVAFLGGWLALVADSIAQVPGNQTVLPLNAVMALLGAPVLIWLMLKQGRQQI
ncbi:iron abc transporter [Leptolyngbya sp. Heron Island J]|uniref:iron ABC transporter permease n=1 Tax=Leptolyngbya sp. Heron Island J TaxID=1385935 RepID=UPI0003B94685|nr:iron ABC transporter permease [Leptolyngbya sp. Heron Island J]ESA35676.1 iron abc transporter [Leptolyngbya sp. Heron Island J]